MCTASELGGLIGLGLSDTFSGRDFVGSFEYRASMGLRLDPDFIMRFPKRAVQMI